MRFSTPLISVVFVLSSVVTSKSLGADASDQTAGRPSTPTDPSMNRPHESPASPVPLASVPGDSTSATAAPSAGPNGSAPAKGPANTSRAASPDRTSDTPALSPITASDSAQRQQEPPTVLDSSKHYAIGGFGGIAFMYSRFAGHDVAQGCLEGGVIVDHVFTLGAGGCGITPSLNAERYGDAPHYPNDRMFFSYGGLIARYHLFSRSPVNLGLGMLVGAGALNINTLNRDIAQFGQVTIGTPNGVGDASPNDYTHRSTDVVFVVEPHVGAYANLNRLIRIGVTGGYRIVSGVNTQGLSSGDLSKPTVGAAIHIGWF